MQIRILKVVLLFMLFVSGTVFSQNITIKGKVLDAETNQPVEFANIGIVGSFMGTASDFNGGFELTISEEFRSYPVRISAVGYQPKELRVGDLIDEIGVNVKLIQQSYGIDQVEVMAESKRLYGILKTAANMISDNYMQAYASNVYFSQTVSKSQKTEVALDYADASGYGDRSYNNAYQKRDYKVKEVRRNFEQKPLKKGMLRADDVLEFDIVRVRGNVLDADVVDQFDLELVKNDSSPKDSVWVIKYSLSKPDFAATGDEQVISYIGVVYISSVDYAILRNELEVVSKGYHHAGRASGLVSSSGEYSYKVNTSYRKAIDNKYALSKIEYSGSGSTTIDMIWVNYDYRSEMDTQIKGRSYYTTQQTDDSFWNRFTLPKE
ncbi:carboxypeptidase-like regulatory domain-containing protein [Carboxylicivirga linearis]|uniref:Carboxypeptidase-like regulatory domain-containing protein n=1 Tax=Carboxylicivirga linearis TaxID=1628157 RepID=A0ABS5K011_9BACT|nr:carboxypeptidase-like regulatory domain-containing protein [Carboxylicivirga linearis]MBS2100512.1 carboxypeptidase-like regulatory domain-containing protein [Carboxylicivirga linearis]